MMYAVFYCILLEYTLLNKVFLFILSGDVKMPDLIKDVRAKGGHETVLKGVVFKGQAELKDEAYLESLCPDTDVTFIDHIANAAVKSGWKVDLEGYNEYDLFLAQYARLKQIASRRLGVAALELFDRYQKLVEAAILQVTTDGTETGHFYGQKAKVGSIQWLIRPIIPQSVGLCLSTGGAAACSFDDQYLIYKYGTKGDKGVVQRKDSKPATGNREDVYQLVSEKQILVIFGYTCNLNPRAILHVQEYVNDGVGTRIPIDIYTQMNMTDIGLTTRPGALVVNEGKQLGIAARTIVDDIYSDIFPFGVDICTADTDCLTSIW